MWTPGAASQGRRAWALVLGMGSWILSWLYDIWIYTNQLYIFFARLSKIGNGNVFCSVILMHQSWHKPFDSRFSCQRNRQICRSANLCCAFIAIHRCGVWGLRVDKNPAPQRICLGCRIEKHPKKHQQESDTCKSFEIIFYGFWSYLQQCNRGVPLRSREDCRCDFLGTLGVTLRPSSRSLIDRSAALGRMWQQWGVDGGGTGRFKTSKCYIFYSMWIDLEMFGDGCVWVYSLEKQSCCHADDLATQRHRWTMMKWSHLGVCQCLLT